MAEKNLTTVQIEKETSELLGKLASADLRSKNNELRWLIEQELCRRESIGIVAVQELPHPDGAQVVPVVCVEKG